MDVTETAAHNRYADASLTLKKGREALIGDLLAGQAPEFLDDHARLIDDYFCQSYEKSVVGPKMDIATRLTCVASVTAVDIQSPASVSMSRA